MNATSTDVKVRRNTLDARLRQLVWFAMISGVAMLATIAIYAGINQPPTPPSYGKLLSQLLILLLVSNFIASLLLLLVALQSTKSERKVMRANVWGPPQAFWKGPLREEQSRSYPRLSELEHRVLRHPEEASVFELMLVADLALRRPNDLYAHGDYSNVYSELFRREVVETFKQALTRSFTPLYTPQGPIPFVTDVRRAEFKGFLGTASDLAVMRRLEELTVAPAADLSRHERFQRAEEVQELEQELSYRDIEHLYNQIKKKVEVEDEE